MKKILVFGATSAIAHEVNRLYAKEGARFFLIGRDLKKLEASKLDLKARGASEVTVEAADLTRFEGHEPLIRNAVSALGTIDLAILAHGTLSEQIDCEKNTATMISAINTNFISHAAILNHLAPVFEMQKHGVIGVYSSVAGDRGRASNYVYGSAKAGLSAFSQGLRARLFRSGVNVVTIKPGFVKTPMTAHLKQGILFAEASTAARFIYRGLNSGCEIVYAPFFWRFIMLVLSLIPERLFKRLRI